MRSCILRRIFTLEPLEKCEESAGDTTRKNLQIYSNLGHENLRFTGHKIKWTALVSAGLGVCRKAVIQVRDQMRTYWNLWKCGTYPRFYWISNVSVPQRRGRRGFSFNTTVLKSERKYVDNVWGLGLDDCCLLVFEVALILIFYRFLRNSNCI